MKKTYINPEMEIVKIETQQIIATSSLGMGSGDVNPGGADSRFFDDIEEINSLDDINGLQNLLGM